MRYTYVNVSGLQYVHCRNQLHVIEEQMEQLKYLFPKCLSDWQIIDDILIRL